MQNGDAVRQLHDHLHVVLDDQDGEILGDAAHQLHGVVRFRGAHAGGRLIEAQQLRLGGERDADLEVALLAVREIGGQLIGLVEQAHGLQHGFGLADDVVIVAVVLEHAPAVPPRLRGDAHVLERGGIGEDVGDLVGAGDALLRDAIGRQPGDVLAVEDDATGGRTQHAGQAIEEGALARPVGADDGADLAALDFEVDVVERGQTTEADGQAFRTQHRGGGVSPALPGRGARVESV